MDWNWANRSTWLGYVAAIVIVFLAALLRMGLVEALGPHNTYLTFFPAVMITALFAGFYPSLLAIGMSGICVSCWPDSAGQFSISCSSDWVGLAVFVMCCLMMSCLAGAVYRSRLRANEAEARAQVLAEKEKAALELCESRDRLNLALESGGAGTWERDLISDKPYWDSYTYKLHGLEPGTFSGRQKDFLNMIHPDDRDRVRDEISRAVNGTADYSTTYGVIWPDSSVHYIADRGKVYRDITGRAVRMIGVKWDITRLHAADEIARASIERLRLVLQAVKDGIWDWNISNDSTILNPNWYTMLGYEPYELPQNFRTWKNLLHPDDAGWVEEKFKEHGARGEGYATEVRMRTKSDGWRWIMARGAVAEYDAEGNPARMVGTLSDVTEFKLATEDLRDSETLFRNLFEHDAAVKLILDAETGKIIDANDSAENFYGWPKEELKKMSIFDINTLSVEEIKMEMESTKQRKKNHFEFQHRLSDGSIREVDVFSSRIVVKGKDLLHSIIHDITERKQAERALQASEDRYRRLFEDAVLGIFRSTCEGKIIDVNPAHARMFGFDSPEEVKSVVTDVAVDLYADPPLRNSIVRTILKAKGPICIENLYKRKDGSKFTGNLHAWVVRHNDGEPQYLEGFIEDITERKRAEEEKKRLEARLRQAEKMEAIGTLAGGIAHDFNNILAPIVCYSELALDALPPSSPIRFGQEQILSASLRARDLVKQILTFSRPDGYQQHIPVEISSIVKETMKLLRASLPSSIEISHQIESGMANADPTQVHQILINLCTNAADAMDSEGVLGIELSRVYLSEADLAEAPVADLEPGPHLKLSVSDTGTGMDKATLERIFDPYFTTKEVGKGTGLGLAVVQAIVKRHDGAITIQSELGKGTTFGIYIPATEDGLENNAKAELLPPRGTERILFLDDEQSIAEMGTTILETLGYKVRSETNSRRALEIFQSRPDDFDLIITDCTMPKITGVELARKVRSIRPDIPIIVSTGFSQRIKRKTAVELGLELIMKPFNVRQLAELVRKVLEVQQVDLNDTGVVDGWYAHL